VQGTKNQLQEHNEEIRALERRSEDQLATENTPEKVCNKIGTVAKSG